MPRSRFLLIFSLLIFLSLSAAFGAKKINVFTADNIVQLVKEKISQTKTFSGSFVYAYANKTFSGLIKYKSPNRFLMSFYGRSGAGAVVETGQKFISDGKNLWLVFKDQNIAINETL